MPKNFTIDKQLKKLGLFGGTFDPIHNGHIKAAIEIKKNLHFDHIYFIPAYISPHKTHLCPSSLKHRLEMLKKALVSYSDFSISEYELNKKGISYTIDTIQYYKKNLPLDSELYWILGSDSFLGISQWKEPNEIFANSSLLILGRPEHPLKPPVNLMDKILNNPAWAKEFIAVEDGKHYRHFTGHKILFFESSFINISSSEIRQKIANHESFSSFVPSEVEAYIKANHLYEK